MTEQNTPENAPANAPENTPEEAEPLTTDSGLALHVDNGETVATEPNGTVRRVEGDIAELAHKLAHLLNL